MDQERLLTLAREARKNAYAPYSGFSVGAALLARDGQVFLGANVENASYTPTCCAERVALFSAVFAGEREFDAIAVVGGFADGEKPFCYPCGVCRQALSEFAREDLRVILADEAGNLSEMTLGELLPHRFHLS